MPLTHTHINLLTVETPARNEPKPTPFHSLIHSLSAIHWPSNNHSFRTVFNAQFYNDPLVIKQVNQIINAEVSSGLLEQSGVSPRKKQLLKWLRDYYYKQCFDASIINKTTAKDYRLTLRLAYIMFSFILSHIFRDGIWIEKSSFDKFRDRLTNKNILLLPNHKSHIDYIIIHYLYVKFNLETPMVIAGENLNVPIFGPILKNLGAIFIKRKFNIHKDFYYVQNIQNLIKFKFNHDFKDNGTGVELFIEGTRSRNGKLMHPKTGFLSILKDSLQGDNDAYIQPISLAYEKPYEFDQYLIELNGLDKNQESFSSILFTGLNLLLGKSPNFGKLIINFSDDMIKFDSTQDVFEIGEKVLEKIEDSNYIIENSVLSTSLLIHFYETSDRSIKKHDVIPIYRTLVDLIIKKNSHNEILKESLEFTSTQLILWFDEILSKFLKEDIIITQDSYTIKNEISLVYYKNSLLNLFISETFHSKSRSPTSLKILSKIFQFEFLTSLLKLFPSSQSESNQSIFINLLNPFLESYELALTNLIGIITINLKDWLHLIYISKQKTIYQESLNKSNLLNALYTFQSINLLKINKSNDIIIINEIGIVQLKEYLNSIRNNSPFIANESVVGNLIDKSNLSINPKL